MGEGEKRGPGNLKVEKGKRMPTEESLKKKKAVLKDQRQKIETTRVMVDRLVTLCLSLHEYPLIRFRTENHVTRCIAEQFQEFQTAVRAGHCPPPL